MKFLKLAVVLPFLTTVNAHASGNVDAKSMGMSGVGVASGDFTQASLNPALLTKFDDNDDFYMQLGVSAKAKDYRSTIDKVDSVQQQLTDFEAMIDAGASSGMTLAQAEENARFLIESLKDLDDEQIKGQVSGSFSLLFPSKKLAVGLTLETHVFVKGDFSFADSDEALIENALMSGDFSLNDIESNGDARAMAATSVGLSLATELDLDGMGLWSVGVVPKLQRLDTYAYNASVANYDNGDFFDKAYRSDDMAFNVDVGIYKSIAMFEFGVVGRNLMSQEIVNIFGEKMTLNPTVVAGVAYVSGGFSAAVDVNIIEDDSFVIRDNGFLKPSQWARAGIETDVYEQFQLRAGYRTDLAGNHDDYYSVGVGLSPFDLFSVDVAAEMSKEKDYGAMVQLGLKF